MTDCKYLRPASLDEAVAMLQAEGPSAKLIAGGVALVAMLNVKLFTPEVLIDISRLRGLQYVREDGEGLDIGALATHAQVAESPIVIERYPILREMVRQVGCDRIRNRGTIGGNLAHADPQEDPPAALIALGASVRVVGPRGERRVPVDAFFKDYMQTVLSPDEILVEVQVPAPPPRQGWSFIKFGPRRAMDYTSTISVGVVLTLAAAGTVGDVGIGLSGLGSTPCRGRRGEEALRGQRATEETVARAAAAVRGDIDPGSDLQYSAEYKADITPVLVRRALLEALGRA